jgi:hypothetical protein
MATVPAVLKSRWRTRNLVGDAKHQLVVRVRKGYVARVHQPMRDLNTNKEMTGIPVIWGHQNSVPYQGQWTPTSDWITLPNVQSAKFTRSIANDNGSSTLTVLVDDIAFPTTTGAGGVYHEIQRGYYSPQRGVKVITRPKMWASTGWSNVLNGGWQIEVWEGYGPDNDPSVVPLPDAANTFAWTASVGPTIGHWTKTADGGGNGKCVPPSAAICRTWTGLIDQCVIASHPDVITLTARDFGLLITDQQMVTNVKAPEVIAPAQFADKAVVLGETRRGYGPVASGTLTGYSLSPAISTVGTDYSGWCSDSQNVATDRVWLEIKLKEGQYEDFYIATESPHLEAYVAIQAASSATQPTTRWNQGAVTTGDWVNGGHGQVPGTVVNYVNYIKTVAKGGVRLRLGGILNAAEGTVLRIYLSNLDNNIYDFNGTSTTVRTVPGYVATVYRLWAYRLGRQAINPGVPIATGAGATVKAQGWVLIDDCADIARVLFMWAGFHEWDVDNFGWSLAGNTRSPTSFNIGQDKYFIDVLADLQNQANYLFYMTAPSDHDLSIGVPCFKRQRVGSNATTNYVGSGDFALAPSVAATLRDEDFLEAFDVAWDLTSLPEVIIFRGSQNPDGFRWGQDRVQRYQGRYYPPWSGLDYTKVNPNPGGTGPSVASYNSAGRIAGVLRKFVQTQGQVISLSMDSTAECLFACVLTGIQFGLAETNATVQISGLPGIELNGAVTIIDEATGTNSRMWVNSIESDHSMGEGGSWHMTVQGPLLDTIDMSAMAEDWSYVNLKYKMARGA